MKKFSQSLQLLLYNFRDILIFEIIYNIFLNALTVPFLRTIINSAVTIAGYQYISNKNLKNFLLCPSTAVILMFVVIFISVCTLFEISAVVYRFTSSINHRTTGIPDMFLAGGDACIRAFRKGNFSVIAYSALVLPVTKLSAMSDIAVSVGIPNIISYYAKRKQIVLIIYIIAAAAVLICFIKWIFSINYYVCEKNSFSISRKKSNGLIKGKFFRTFFSVALWELSAVIFS
jgi:membrane-anchored glycerophosphoryl diester phosphodiesterase (GDPDase)